MREGTPACATVAVHVTDTVALGPPEPPVVADVVAAPGAEVPTAGDAVPATTPPGLG